MRRSPSYNALSQDVPDARNACAHRARLPPAIRPSAVRQAACSGEPHDIQSGPSRGRLARPPTNAHLPCRALDVEEATVVRPDITSSAIPDRNVADKATPRTQKIVSRGGPSARHGRRGSGRRAVDRKAAIPEVHTRPRPEARAAIVGIETVTVPPTGRWPPSAALF